MTANVPRPRDRNSNLKKYYGLGANNGNQSLDIDGDAFDPGKYFAKAMKEKSLNGLVACDNTLVAEIREIDGDMKTLVYENYSKFISATDTVRKMKSNVESMESEMERLNQSVSVISSKSHEIHTALTPNREKITRLTKTASLLKRVQFLLELPNRLNQCLATGQYAQAVKYYTRMTRLLAHYQSQNMSAFQGIEKDCTETMEKVKEQLRLRLQSPASPVRTLDQAVEDIRLLLLLKESPKALWTEFLETQLKRYSCQKRSTPESLNDFVSWLIPLEKIIKQFNTLFLTSEENDIQEAKQDLYNAVTPSMDHFLEQVSEYKDPNSGQLSLKIRDFRELQAALSQDVPALLDLTGLDKKLDDLVARKGTDLVDEIIKKTTSEIKDRYDELKKVQLGTTKQVVDQSVALGEKILELESWSIRYLQADCLDIIHENICPECHAMSKDGYYDHVRQYLEQLMRSLLDIFSGLYKDEEQERAFLVVESRLCYDYAEHALIQIYQSISKHHEDNRIMSDMQAMADKYIRHAQKLLQEYVMEEGFCLASSIEQTYLQNSALAEKPSSVSKVWFRVGAQLQYTEQLVEAVYPQQVLPDAVEAASEEQQQPQQPDLMFGEDGLHIPPPSSTTTTTSSSATTTTGDATAGLGILGYYDMTVNNMMTSNIDKLFAERVDIYRHVDATPEGVCAGLLSVLMKAFHETVRQMRLDTHDYQQLQTDVEYLRQALSSYTWKDHKWMVTMLQDIISSAYIRCPSPVPLTSEELERALRRMH